MAPGEGNNHIANLVDALLEADKVLVGVVHWHDGTRSEDKRFDWPVLVGGETAECAVAATAYPDELDLRFTITLNYRSHNIWRIDHDPPYRRETNPFLTGHRYSGDTIRGPHFHPWVDNRHEATPATFPTLCWRRPLPSQVQGWENTFRWFLGETNIGQPETIPSLPRRMRLV